MWEHGTLRSWVWTSLVTGTKNTAWTTSSLPTSSSRRWSTGCSSGTLILDSGLLCCYYDFKRLAKMKNKSRSVASLIKYILSKSFKILIFYYKEFSIILTTSQMCNYCRMLCGGSMLSRTVWRVQFCSICGHHCRSSTCRRGNCYWGSRGCFCGLHNPSPTSDPCSIQLIHATRHCSPRQRQNQSRYSYRR